MQSCLLDVRLVDDTVSSGDLLITLRKSNVAMGNCYKWIDINGSFAEKPSVNDVTRIICYFVIL
jgi:hypothetical protein